MGADLGNILITSGKAIGEVIVLGVVGYLGSAYGLLTHDATKVLSRVIYFILMPALILSNSVNFTVANFRQWYILPLFGLAHILVGVLLAGLSGTLLRVQKPELRMMIMGTAFDNWAALPLTLLAGISTNWVTLKGRSNASSQGQAMCVLYSIPWTLIFFSAGLKFLRGGEKKDGAWGGLNSIAVTGGAKLRSEMSIELEGSRLLLDHNAESRMSDDPTERMTGSAGHRFETALKPKKTPSKEPQWVEAPPDVKEVQPGVKHAWIRHLWAQLLPLIQVPSIIAQLLGLFLGLLTPLRETFFGDGKLSFVMDAMTMFGKALLPFATIVLGASMQSTIAHVTAQRAAAKTHAAETLDASSRNSAPKAAADDHRVEPIKLPSTSVTIATCLAKLILMPAIFFPFSLWMFRSGLLGDEVDPLLQLVVMIQAIAPGAEQVVVMYKLYGFTERASSLSFIFLVEYLASILTISGCLVIAMSMIS